MKSALGLMATGAGRLGKSASLISCSLIVAHTAYVRENGIAMHLRVTMVKVVTRRAGIKIMMMTWVRCGSP